MRWMKILCAAALLFAGTLSAADQRLVEAAKQGNQALVRSLLQQHVDVNAPQGDGATALFWAVHRGDVAITDLLLRAGANVNAANAYGVTPLNLACSNGDPALLEKLLAAKANPNAALPSGETALMTASRAGNLRGVQLLIARGADVNAKESKRGQTALMWALSENHVDVAKELVEHGADVQARTKAGFTVLMFAAQQGNVEAGRMLVAAGAKVNDSNPHDGTPLVVAAASGHQEFAAFLLDKDALPNATDGYGITALHYAVQRGLSLVAGVEWYSWAPELYRPDMTGLVNVLLAHGANPNARITKAPPLPGVRRLAVINVEGATPYILAAAASNAGLMRTLVKAGADPGITTKEHTTALIFAAGLANGLGKLPPRTPEDDRRALECVKLAVELGDDVTGKNDDGVVALHGAAYVGSDSITEFLIEKGADVNARDSSGQTPFTIASQIFPATLLDDNLRPEFVHKSTVEILVKHGAQPYVAGAK